MSTPGGRNQPDGEERDLYESVDSRLGPEVVDGRLPVAWGPAAIGGVGASGDEGSTGERFAHTADASEEPWRLAARRWLATLNPGRTRREYEKAVGYFFETPGVPQVVEDLTFDLLLAYRGALALRASGRESVSPAARAAQRAGQRAMLGAPERGRIAEASGASTDDTAPAEGEYGAGGRMAEPAPLAPATVNVRLTALRQFLVYCALFGSLPRLTPDQIRASLRRLTLERRRPYQVLAEPEWGEFLAAASWPAQVAREAVTSGTGDPGAMGGDDVDGEAMASATVPAVPRSPWGIPRAVRRRREEQTEHASDAGQARVEATPLPRSRAGLTGERTAQRDHALIALALATGLRAIELSSLDVGDLSREWHRGRQEWWLVLPDAKTKGQRGGRTLPLDPDIMETLLAYLAVTGRRWERAGDRATPLFLCGAIGAAGARRRRRREGGGDTTGPVREPRRLSPSHIRRIVDRVETQWLTLREQGEEGAALGAVHASGETRLISPHALRHSTAIALLEGNETSGRPPASVEHVRGWLGHFDIRTTQGYLAHLEGRQHRRPFALSPGGGAWPIRGANADRRQTPSNEASDRSSGSSEQ